MYKFCKSLFYLIVFLLVACQGQTKEDLVREGLQLMEQGNPLGAVVYFRNALDNDPNYTEARYQLGLAYLRAKKYPQAKKELHKVHLQDPAHNEVLLDLAAISLAEAELAEAEDWLEQFMRKTETTARSQYYLGIVHQSKGDFPQAESLYRDAMRLDKQYLEAHAALARMYLAQGRNDEALALLEAATITFPHNKLFYMMLATLEVRRGDIDAALRAYDRVIEIDPETLSAYYFAGMLVLNGDPQSPLATEYAHAMQQRFPEHPATSRFQGILAYVKGDLDNALILLRKSIKKMPDLSGYYFLGLTEFALKHYELALNQFQKALDLNPEHLQSRVLLGMTLLQQKRIDDCIYQISQVLRADESVAIAHNVLGTAYLAKGDYDVAMQHFDRAITLNPQLADPHLKKGLLNLSQRNTSGAELELERALAIAPESLNTRFMLASLYLKQRNFQGVIELLEPALDGSERDAVLYNYMAAAYLAQKDTPQGIAALQKAKAAKANFFAPYFNLASAYLAQKKNAAAQQEYAAVLELAPENIKALVSLAALQEISGEQEAAKATYERAMATNAPQGFLAFAGYCARNRDPQTYARVVEAAYAAHSQHPGILKLRGRLMLARKNFAEAVITFEALNKIDPVSGGAMLAATWLASGEQDKAIGLAAERMRQNPEAAPGYLLMAAIRQRLGQQEEVEQVLQQGISRVRDARILRLRLGGFYVSTKRIQEAETVLRKLHADAPEFAAATYALGVLQDQRGYKQEAEGLYRDVLDKNREHTGAMNNLAYLYAENNADPQKALNLAMRAFQNEPSSPAVMDTLGLALLKNERYQEAVNILNKASQQLEDVATVRLHQAMALIGLGDSASAREVLKHVIELKREPELTRAQALLKQLNAETAQPRG